MAVSKHFSVCLAVLLLVSGSGLPGALAGRQLLKNKVEASIVSEARSDGGTIKSEGRIEAGAESVSSKAIAKAVSTAFAEVRARVLVPCRWSVRPAQRPL